MRITSIFSLLCLILCYSVDAQVGIGTTTPSSSAILDLTSSNKALILPRMNQAQINAIANPVPGMVVFCTNGGGTGGCVQIYEDDRWHCINEQKIWFNTCGIALAYYETYLGGRIWLDRNLGSKTILADASDSLGYGSLFQWGRLGGASTHHCVDWTSDPPGLSATTTTQLATTSVSNAFVISHNDWATSPDGNLWTVGQSPDNNPCPSGYRVPTVNELLTAFGQCGLTVDALAKSALHWAPAGYRTWNTGILTNSGKYLYYWSRDAGLTDPNKSYWAYFSNIDIEGIEGYRAQGMSVRCVKQ